MSPLNLPDDIRYYCYNQLKTWFNQHKENSLLVQGERAQIQRLLDYLEVVKKPHRRATEEQEKLWHDFKSFYSQYDSRRGKNFEKTFPKILADWYRDIKIDKTIEFIDIQKLGDNVFNTEFEKPVGKRK